MEAQIHNVHVCSTREMHPSPVFRYTYSTETSLPAYGKSWNMFQRSKNQCGVGTTSRRIVKFGLKYLGAQRSPANHFKPP